MNFSLYRRRTYEDGVWKSWDYRAVPNPCELEMYTDWYNLETLADKLISFDVDICSFSFPTQGGMIDRGVYFEKQNLYQLGRVTDEEFGELTELYLQRLSGRVLSKS